MFDDDYEIVPPRAFRDLSARGLAQDDAWHAVPVHGRMPPLTVLPDAEDARIVHRREISGVGSGAPEYRSALVATLGGVRLYVAGGALVLTTRELELGGDG